MQKQQYMFRLNFNSENYSRFGIVGNVKRLHSFTKFRIPGAQFSKKFKKKHWDGCVSVIRYNKMAVGMLPYLIEKCSTLDDVTLNFFLDGKEVTGKEIADHYFAGPSFNSACLDLLLEHLPSAYPPRDYQLSSVTDSMFSARASIILPTGSGKSLCLYLQAALLFDKLQGPGLILCPRIHLVEQLEKDFALFSNHRLSPSLSIEGRDILTKIEDPRRTLIISTIQSWLRWSKDDDLDLPTPKFIIGDEAHTYAGKGVEEYVTLFEGVKYRYGLTATNPDVALDRLNLEGVIGPVVYTKSPEELIEAGVLAKPQIHQIIIEHKVPLSEAEDLPEGVDFKSKDHLLNREPRLKLITQMTAALPDKAALLVLCEKVDTQIKPLAKYMRESDLTDAKIITLDRYSNKKERADVVELMNNPTEKTVLLVTYGLFQMGVNVPNLVHLLMYAPSASMIRVLQSIGRVLRPNSPCHVYDLVDYARDDDNRRKTPKSAGARIRIYEAAYGSQHDMEKIEWVC